MVVFGDSHGRHGTDIEAKQATTNNGDGRDNVNVSNLIHDGRCSFSSSQVFTRRK